MNAVEGRSVVIVAYRPKPGKEAALLELMRTHVPILREEGLATSREPIVCQSRDGTVVEVFEWEAGGIDKAHRNPRVGAMWKAYWECCEILPLKSLVEAGDMFAGFKPI